MFRLCSRAASRRSWSVGAAMLGALTAGLIGQATSKPSATARAPRPPHGSLPIVARRAKAIGVAGGVRLITLLSAALRRTQLAVTRRRSSDLAAASPSVAAQKEIR